DREWMQMDEDSRRIAALEQWTANEIPILDELYDLTDRFPDTRTLRLARLTLDPVPRTAKSKYAARMLLTGVATDDFGPINDLMAHLVADGHSWVKPKEVGGNTGGERFQGFSQQFKLPVDIEKVGAEKYTRRLHVPPPVRESRGPQGFDMGFGDMGGQP